jgi:hypothetical protein
LKFNLRRYTMVIYGLSVGLILIPVVLSVLPLPDAPHLQEHGGGDGHGEGKEEGGDGMQQGVSTVDVTSTV